MFSSWQKSPLAGWPSSGTGGVSALALLVAVGALQAPRASPTPIHPTQPSLQKEKQLLNLNHSNQLTSCLEENTQDELAIKYPGF